MRIVEDDICPRCGAAFRCSKSAKCWCYEINVSSHILESIQSKWERCLCPACLEEMAKEKSKEGSLPD